MDRDWLTQQLAAGRSIEAIARESGRSASTVGYWVNKYGLVSRHAARHAARGGIDEQQLRALVEEGLTVRAMAQRLDLSYSASATGCSATAWPRLAAPGSPRPLMRERRAWPRRWCTAPFTARAGMRAAPTAACAASPAGAMPLLVAGGRSRRRWWPRREASAVSAAMRGRSARCTSITSSRARRRSPSAGTESPVHSPQLAQKRRSASCSARRVMPRSRAARSGYPFRRICRYGMRRAAKRRASSVGGSSMGRAFGC